MRHEDWTVVSAHLCEVRQGAAMVEMEVGDNHRVDLLVKVARLADKTEIRKTAFIIKAHVHTAVDHNIVSIDRNDQT